MFHSASRPRRPTSRPHRPCGSQFFLGPGQASRSARVSKDDIKVTLRIIDSKVWTGLIWLKVGFFPLRVNTSLLKGGTFLV